jgi:arylsulfatase A-like enzyme
MVNIVYIHSHDTGRYVQPYGYSIPTPAIQRLAEEGTLFRKAFCANPTCSPSRASLLTGQWAHSCGMGGLVNRGWSLPHPDRLLPNFLRQNGYATVRAGIQHVVTDPEEGGYSRILEGESGDWNTVARARSFLKEKHDQPFFLDVGFFATHRLGDGFSDSPKCQEPTNPNYVRPPTTLPDNSTTRGDMGTYIDAARTLDDLVGTVVQSLDEQNLADNTLVICTTDHGIAFPRMKCNLTDHGMGVMMILRGPGGFTGGGAIDGLVSHIDLFPTVCELTELPFPAWLQGVSLMPLVNGLDRVRSEIFSEINYHVCYEPQRAVRTERWKYILRLHDRAQPVLPDCDNGPSKSYLLENDWELREEPKERLYDLVFDPNEARNIIDCEEVAEELAHMRALMQKWREETDDPLITQKVFDPPPTAQVVDPNVRSGRDAKIVSARSFLGLE